MRAARGVPMPRRKDNSRGVRAFMAGHVPQTASCLLVEPFISADFERPSRLFASGFCYSSWFLKIDVVQGGGGGWNPCLCELDCEIDCDIRIVPAGMKTACFHKHMHC